MSRKTSQSEYRISQMLIAVVYLLLVSMLGIVTTAAAAEGRVSTSRHYTDGGRARTQTPGVTVDLYGSLKTEGPRGRSPGSPAATAGNAGKPSALDFWFFSADVVLFGDDDIDGYFFGIDLLFDVDTIWSAADIYAVTYLSYEGGPWNEYAATENFTIFESSADDEYNIVTELESGYLTGSYDLLIEIFDAQTGEFLVSFGPEETADLGFLPLEDFNRDTPSFDVPIATSTGHGGGSTGLWTLLALLLTLASRKAPRQTDQSCLVGPPASFPIHQPELLATTIKDTCGRSSL